MEIWLVRHGETDWNVAGRIQGWTDIPLNAAGTEQAKRLAQHFTDTQFEHIYSSDLARAKATAEAIAAHCGREVTSDTLLREQYFGQSEGLLRDEMKKAFPNGCEDAESPEELEKRVTQVLQSISSRHSVGPILVTTHGGVVRAILRWLGHQLSPITNTSITRLCVKDGEFQVLTVNETPHLPEETNA